MADLHSAGRLAVHGRRRGNRPRRTARISDVHGFLVDGTIGVSYAPGVWHAGATVLNQRGHFAVLWPRQGSELDEVFLKLPRPLLVGAE